MSNVNTKKMIIVVSGIALGIIAVIFCINIWYNTLIKPVNLESLKWQKIPNIIAISDSHRENNDGILFVKLQNGDEQFIAGQWEVSFTDSGNVYAFGEFPPNYSSQKGQQLYLISDDEKIYDIEINIDNNTIISIQESHDTAYMLVEIKTATGKIYCVAEQTNTEKSTDCEQINISGEGQGLWHPNKDHEAVVKDNNDNIFTLDPWNPILNHIDSGNESEQYTELLAFFKDQDQNKPNTVDNKTFWKIANLIVVKDNDGGWSFHPVPFFAKTNWISDGEHLLIKEGNKLSVLDIMTHELATVLEEDGIGNHKIQFRVTNIDQIL